MKILFLGYNQEQTSLINFLKNKGYEVFHYQDKINLEFCLNFDYIISYGYRYIIKKDIINHFKNKIINLHISYLPYNKGSHPNFWSFLKNTSKGVTIHFIDEGIDTGDILLQKKVNFTFEEDTFTKTYNKLNYEIENLFIENYQKLLENKILPIKQTNEGDIHYIKDLKQYEYLLPQRWDTKISNIESFLKLREATFDDWKILLDWRNDHTTRINSLNSNPTLENNHKVWLLDSLQNINRKIYILENNLSFIGTIRSDKISKDTYILSWVISPDYRGKGYGSKILEIYLKNKSGNFLAEIKTKNIASIKIVQKNGFKLCSTIVYDEKNPLIYIKTQ